MAINAPLWPQIVTPQIEPKPLSTHLMAINALLWPLDCNSSHATQ